MSRHVPPVALVTALSERYTIGDSIGSGGMAIIFQATDRRHDRSVAIKMLRPGVTEDVPRFMQEIRLIARLQHPNILPLIDSGEAGGVPYYITPYVAGATLKDELAREGRLSVSEACRLGAEIADAVAAAHRAGIVHRDIKPANVLLSGGHALIADFGIARAIGEVRITAAGMSLGTPQYMSPEQAAGDLEIGPASDQYSLACVLYEMLTGAPPFDAAAPAVVMQRQLLAPPPDLLQARPEVPPAIGEAVRRALQKEAGARFPTIEAFGQILRKTRVSSTVPRL